MKKIDDYKLIVVDLDGTLYYQKPLRIKMAFSLLFYYAFRPHKIKELLVIKDYRKLREKTAFNGEENIEEKIIETLATKYKKDVDNVKNIIHFWMIEKPFKYIKKYEDKNLVGVLQKAKEKGVKIVVYSDNPADEKMKAINLDIDGVFCATDKDVCCFKPEIKGLMAIMNKFSVSHNQTLFVGDRQEKDGKCAENAGVDCVILSTKKTKRNKQFKEFLFK